MAAFREHVSVSSVLGVGYASAAWWSGAEPAHAALAGVLCGVAGMLPDLDSPSGRPVRELFSLTAAVVPMVLLRRMRHWGVTGEGAILIALGIYAFIRFAIPAIMARITVHRGMFHSLPAAVIAAELAYLAHDCDEPSGQWMMAAGVLIGFLSHLLLDELYSVDLRGVKVRLKASAGTAVKLFSSSVPATLTTWLLLAGTTYFVLADRGVVPPVGPAVRMAIREAGGTHRH